MELSLTLRSASIPAMLFAQLALLVLAFFAVALVVRFVLSFRKFQRRFDESLGQSAERFRRHVEQPLPRPGESEKPRSP